MKKILLLLCLLIIIFPYGQVVYAEDSLENQITDAVEEQVGNLDLNGNQTTFKIDDYIFVKVKNNFIWRIFK